MEPPPTHTLPTTAVSDRDLCEAMARADVLGALGIRGDLVGSADGRVCSLPKQLSVAFWSERGYTVPSANPESVQIGPATAQVRRDICELIIPVDAAPPGAPWAYDSILARSVADGGPPCDRFIASLAPLVTLLSNGG